MFIIDHIGFDRVHLELCYRFWRSLIKDCCQQGISTGIAPDILISQMILFFIKFILFLVNLLLLISLDGQIPELACWLCCFRTTFFPSTSCFVYDLNIFYLAAVLLKQFIKQHWQEDEESFIQPVVTIEEKVISRSPSYVFLDLGCQLIDSYLLGKLMLISKCRDAMQ